jgi:anti-sigma factor RsiW
MHVDAEQLQRFLDGELSAPEQGIVREHLAQCADCRGRVAAARQADAELQAQLRQLDHTPPRITAAQVVARAMGARAPGVRRFGWAAGIVLALGIAGAAYAAPGSPLRGWVRAALTWVGAGKVEQAPAGIAVAPGAGLVITFTSAQTAGLVRVSLTDGAEVVVRAPRGAGTFTSDVERLVIHNSGSAATFDIEIPRAAPRVEIHVQGARVFVKEGARVTGPWEFPLAP